MSSAINLFTWTLLWVRYSLFEIIQRSRGGGVIVYYFQALSSDRVRLYSAVSEKSYVLAGRDLQLLDSILVNRHKDNILSSDLIDFSNKETLKILAFFVKVGILSLDHDKGSYTINIGNIGRYLKEKREGNVVSHNTMPPVVYWIFTNACNLSCSHCCWADHRMLPDELEIYERLKIVNDIASCGVVKLSFSGGEPLVRYEELVKCVAAAKMKGIDLLCIATNGKSLNEDRIGRLLNAGLSEIQISLDSYLSRKHNELRGAPGLFEHIVEISRYINKTLPRHSFAISITLTQKNKDSIDETIDFATSELGAGKIKIIRFNPVVKGTEELAITDPVDMVRISEKLIKKKKLLKLNGVELKLPHDFSLMVDRCSENPQRGNIEDVTCAAMRQRVCVLPNGAVSPCPQLSSLGVIVGNLKSERLDEIWNGRKAVEFRTISKKDNIK